MRQMSFYYTQPQFLARTKTVTRRLGWTFLKRGDRVMGVVKGQGLRKGGQVETLGIIQIIAVRRERLNAITSEEVACEGFPEMTRQHFIDHFCEINRPCAPDWLVTRIEFAYEETP